MSALRTPSSTYVAAARVVETSTVFSTEEMIEYEETLWDKIDDKLQLWRVRSAMSAVRFYTGLLISPRKLAHLPSLVTQLQHLQWHELSLADDHANGRAGRCKISQKKHELMAEEYAEILGVFHEEDDRVVTRFE